MITRLFALRLFEGFSITRWNDRIRPFELTEMDKNALKAVIVYFLGRYEENHGKKIDWNYIIYGIFFGLLKNIVLSDIKSPVHRKIKNQYKEEFKKLNQWVVDQYRLIIDDNDFLDRFSKFLNEVSDENSIELRILRASHKFSTLLEFKIIEPFNLSSPFINNIRKDIYSEIEKYMDLYGLRDLIAENKLYDLVRTIEQLRFQVRWSQTPRMPKTSVLGHSFYVACLMIVFSRKVEACNKRMFNNFFGGLFHDLPESVTRDIISPVKRATENFPSIINEIEDEVCKELLFPNIPDFLKEEIYFLIGNIKGGNEFSNRIFMNNKINVLDINKDIKKYNFDKYSPLDGKLVELSDKISAFLEAYISIQHGIKSRHLEDGASYIKRKYINCDSINEISISRFFQEFDF